MICSSLGYGYFRSSHLNGFAIILICCEVECEAVVIVPVSAFYHLCDCKLCATVKSSFGSVNIVKCCFALCSHAVLCYDKLTVSVILSNFIGYRISMGVVSYARFFLVISRNNFLNCQLVCAGLSKLDAVKDYITVFIVRNCCRFRKNYAVRIRAVESFACHFKFVISCLKGYCLLASFRYSQYFLNFKGCFSCQYQIFTVVGVGECQLVFVQIC